MIQEEFGNGKYIHTSGVLIWFSGGDARIVFHDKLDGKISANWINSQTIEIIPETGLSFTKKETKSYFCEEDLRIKYKAE